MRLLPGREELHGRGRRWAQVEAPVDVSPREQSMEGVWGHRKGRGGPQEPVCEGGCQWRGEGEGRGRTSEV